MPNARSESIHKSLQHETTIRDPLDNPLENRIDHYAVLSNVINDGIEVFFHDESAIESLSQATHLKQLASTMHEALNRNIIEVLESDNNAEIRNALRRSQQQRSVADLSGASDIYLPIIGGIGTSLSHISELFHILHHRYGLDTAAQEGNWRIIDRLAKQNIYAMQAYENTYLRPNSFRNWRHFTPQITYHPEGGMHFKAGYPANARINERVDQIAAQHTASDYLLSDETPTVPLSQIGSAFETIGCPVTFRNGIVRGLWGVYATEAYRISSGLRPTADGSGASAR